MLDEKVMPNDIMDNIDFCIEDQTYKPQAF